MRRRDRMSLEIMPKGWEPDSGDVPSLDPRDRGVHCPGCGRYAKALRTEHYYDGNFNCMRAWTDCSKCGTLSEELV